MSASSRLAIAFSCIGHFLHHVLTGLFLTLVIVLERVWERPFDELIGLWAMGAFLIGAGAPLAGWLADRFGRNDRPIKKLTLRDAVLMGMAQAMALVPGVSRSGATLSMGRILGYERAAATRFAFLLAIPAVVGAGVFQLSEIPDGDNAYGWGPTLVGTVVSFVVGYAVIAWLLRWVTTRTYTPFVVYRVALGGAVLVLLSTGVLSA